MLHETITAVMSIFARQRPHNANIKRIESIFTAPLYQGLSWLPVRNNSTIAIEEQRQTQPCTTTTATLESFRSLLESDHTIRDACERFKISRSILWKASEDFYHQNLTLLPASDTGQVIDAFLDYTKLHHAFEIEEHRKVVDAKDFSRPHLWFPIARAIKRKIIYHAGPTNSGKTFNALTAMKTASSGVYCGPLRLLAMEVYEACNLEGTYCSLVTGQEKKLVPGAEHTACTVEMIHLQKQVDVAVLDEIQLIGDQSRGWAWTRALLGVPASEIHVCGDGSALGLIKWIAGEVGEECEVRKYERFTPLEVEEEGLGEGYGNVKPGDCIVAFSRQDIFEIKAIIEEQTSFKTCVVYGALPPETRRQQAKLFNDPNSGYDIMVASDAVGMGLNLNIGRVIFHKMHKKEGHSKPMMPVSVSMIKQIAGRAGRRSSQYSLGKTTCLDREDVMRLKLGLSIPQENLITKKAGIYPEYEQFEAFATANAGCHSFAELMEKFSKQAELKGNYFFCKQDSTIFIARLLEQVEGLSLKDLYLFCMAPASTTDLRINAAMLHFAKRYAAGEACELEIDPGDVPPASSNQMKDFEAAHQVAMLWLWLSNRFGDSVYFPNREVAASIADRICNLLSQGLAIISNDHEQLKSVQEKMNVNTNIGLADGNRRRQKNKGKARKERTCKTAKQLFLPYKQEFFILLNAMKSQESSDDSIRNK